MRGGTGGGEEAAWKDVAWKDVVWKDVVAWNDVVSNGGVTGAGAGVERSRVSSKSLTARCKASRTSMEACGGSNSGEGGTWKTNTFKRPPLQALTANVLHCKKYIVTNCCKLFS